MKAAVLPNPNFEAPELSPEVVILRPTLPIAKTLLEDRGNLEEIVVLELETILLILFNGN